MRTLLVVLSLSSGIVNMGSAHANPPNDEAQIKGLFAAFCNNWNTPGFPDLEKMMTPDVDFVVVTGKWLKGRDSAIAYHRELLKTFYAGSHLTIDAVTVRFVDDRHAVAHLESSVEYTHDGQPIRRPSLATATLNKINGAWLIDTFHNTITGGPGYMFNVAPSLPAKK